MPQKKANKIFFLSILACSIGFSSCTNPSINSTQGKDKLDSKTAQYISPETKIKYRITSNTPGVFIAKNQSELNNLFELDREKANNNSNFKIQNTITLTPEELTPEDLVIEKDLSASSYRITFTAKARSTRLVITDNGQSFETYVYVSYDDTVPQSVELIVDAPQNNLDFGNHTVILQGVFHWNYNPDPTSPYNPYACQGFPIPSLYPELQTFEYLGMTFYQSIIQFYDAQLYGNSYQCVLTSSPLIEKNFEITDPNPSPIPTPSPPEPTPKPSPECKPNIEVKFDNWLNKSSNKENLTSNFISEENCIPENKLNQAKIESNEFAIKAANNSKSLLLSPPMGNRSQVFNFETTTKINPDTTVEIEYGVICASEPCKGKTAAVLGKKSITGSHVVNSSFRWFGGFQQSTYTIAAPDAMYVGYASLIAANRPARNTPKGHDLVEVSCSGFYDQMPKVLLGDDREHIRNRHYGLTTDNTFLKDILVRYSNGKIGINKAESEIREVPPEGKASLFGANFKDNHIFEMALSIGNLKSGADACRTSKDSIGNTNFGVFSSRNGTGINVFVKPNTNRIISAIPNPGVSIKNFYKSPNVLHKFGLKPPK